MRYPGEVWFLPSEAREEGDAKARRHVLLTTCRESGDPATLAYASTQSRDAMLGGAHLWIDPTQTRYGQAGLTGFTRPTYVYPCRLINAAYDDMERMVGRLIDEMADLRLILSQALGIGCGSCNGSGAAAHSWRGRIVRLAENLAREVDSKYAVLLTEPAYSNRRRYQIFVPLLNEDDYEREELDVRVEDPLLGGLELGWNSALLAVRLVQTAFHRHEIESWTGLVVTDSIMKLVDAELGALFDL